MISLRNLTFTSKSQDLPIKKKFSQDPKVGLNIVRSWEKSQGVATLYLIVLRCDLPTKMLF